MKTIKEMGDTKVEKKPNTTKRNKGLYIDVSIKDMELFKVLLNTFTEIVTDEKINKKIRQFYLEEFISNVGD